MLVSGFSVNDFGDTHSLVLLVDSLSVQAAMSQLDSTLDTKSLSKLLAAGGNLFGQAVLFEQGRAEGDTLELRPCAPRWVVGLWLRVVDWWPFAEPSGYW